MDEVFVNKFTRRDFLKKTGQAALAISGGLTLEALLDGCAGAPIFESPEDVANIQWDANPAIPVPKYGCYTGWHRDIPTDLKYISPVAYPSMYPRLNKSAMNDEKALIRSYRADYGKGPAAQSFSDRQITDVWFPNGICEVAHNNGVIPLIRYYFFDDFERVAKGEYDKYLKAFAQSAKEFGKPFFLVPYPEANAKGKISSHPWALKSSKGFKEAWRHMHDIFEDAGANEYAVWGLHLLNSFLDFMTKSLSKFELDTDLFDWIGFSSYNLDKLYGRRISMDEHVGQDFWWAKRNYPNKPFALFEYGTSNTYGQGRRIREDYNWIERNPRIKLVMYCEYPTIGKPTDSTMISDKAKPAYKEAISSPYFIGSKQ